MNKLILSLPFIALTLLSTGCATAPSGAFRPESRITPSPEIEGETMSVFSQLRPGLLGVTATVGEVSADPDVYRSRVPATNIVTTPGYTQVLLEDSNVRIDATAIDQVALYRFTFPETKESHVLLDVSHLLPAFRIGEVHLLDDKTIQGTATYEPEREDAINVAFSAQFSNRFKRRGTWKNGKTKDGQNRAKVDDGSSLGAFVYFWTHEGETILMKMGISTVDVADARKNIEAEFPGWDFDEVRLESEAAWK